MYTIEIYDEATPWLKWAMDEFPGFRRKALKSAGWMMQKKIKAGIKSRMPGGRAYAAFMPAKRRRELEIAFGGKGKHRYAPLGKLARAIGYQYREDAGEVVVGWLSRSAVQLGTLHEKGGTTKVTGKVRRGYLASIGISKTKKEIDIPARPTIGPMKRVLVPEIPGYVEDKIWGYLIKGSRSGIKASRRKYVVRNAF
jgi:hypothetical protein